MFPFTRIEAILPGPCREVRHGISKSPHRGYRSIASMENKPPRMFVEDLGTKSDFLKDLKRKIISHDI